MTDDGRLLLLVAAGGFAGAAAIARSNGSQAKGEVVDRFGVLDGTSSKQTLTMRLWIPRLIETWGDPLKQALWMDKPITRKEVAAALADGSYKTVSDLPFSDGLKPRTKPMRGERKYHARRIAWFVVRQADNEDPRAPIEVDVGIPEFPGGTIDWPILDGNHRYAAAVYRGDASIKANVSGSLPYAKRFELPHAPRQDR